MVTPPSPVVVEPRASVEYTRHQLAQVLSEVRVILSNHKFAPRPFCIWSREADVVKNVVTETSLLYVCRYPTPGAEEILH